jgi:hypothetical protein
MSGAAQGFVRSSTCGLRAYGPPRTWRVAVSLKAGLDAYRRGRTGCSVRGRPGYGQPVTACWSGLLDWPPRRCKGEGSTCDSELGLFTVADDPGDVVKIITRAGVETGFSRPAPTAPDLTPRFLRQANKSSQYC